MRRELAAVLMVAVVVTVSVFVVGCENDAQTGALVGSLAGAGVGQLVGRDTKGTLIGAGVGAGAGYIIGNESDKNKAKAERDYPREEISTVSVNITNSNGSVSTVKLRKQGAVYVGPKGEYYQTLPTGEQLRPVYGF